MRQGELQMPVYLLAYHGTQLPKTENENKELIRAWNAWMDQLGDALEGWNNPVNITRTIAADGTVSAGGGANPVLGLSFITANDIDAAIRLAKTCPHLAAGGSIEVAELIPRSAVQQRSN
jgi:hypothetical protein